MSREEQFSSYKQYAAFERRHIGPTSSQEDEMLKALGYKDMHSFISDVVPSNIAMSKKLSESLPPSLTEVEANAVLMDFLDNYEEFFYWRNEVFDQSREESEAYAESLKPQCQEYPSNNPKYSIVKCTNLP